MGQQEICNWFLNFEMHQSETTCRDEKGLKDNMWLAG